MENLIKQYRYFLKDSVRQAIDFSLTDQRRGIPPPPIQKPYPKDSRRIDLPGKQNLQNIFAFLKR